MQIVKSYTQAGDVSSIQQLRLFHVGRPRVKAWRQVRHGHQFLANTVDQWILDNINTDAITAVDFAGWYFELFGIKTVCLESSDIAKLYWPQCFVEPDVMTWRPTYISHTDPVVFRNPWFLKYATVDQFIAFLETWAQSLTILEFEPRLVQHNHLKFKLLDLVASKTALDVKEITNTLWTITPCTSNK
jgi:hypothetical protein